MPTTLQSRKLAKPFRANKCVYHAWIYRCCRMVYHAWKQQALARERTTSAFIAAPLAAGLFNRSVVPAINAQLNPTCNVYYISPRHPAHLASLHYKTCC